MKTQTVYKNIDDLPVGLSPEDVGSVLGISRAKAYNLCNSEGFPSLRIGKRIVILKDAFIRWMEENTGRQVGA